MGTFKVIDAPKSTTTTAAGLAAAINAAQPGEVITVTAAGDPLYLEISAKVFSGYGVTVVLPEDQLIHVLVTNGSSGIQFVGGRWAADVVLGTNNLTNNGLRVDSGASRIGLYGAILDRNNSGVQIQGGGTDFVIHRCLADICRADNINTIGGQRILVSENRMLPGAFGEKFCYFDDGRAPQHQIGSSTCTAAGGIWEDTSHNDRGQFRSVPDAQVTDLTVADNESLGQFQGWVSFNSDLHPRRIERAAIVRNTLTEDSPWGIYFVGSEILISDNVCVGVDGAGLAIQGIRGGEGSQTMRGGRNTAPSVLNPAGVDLESSELNGDVVVPPELPRLALPPWLPEVVRPADTPQNITPEAIGGPRLRWHGMPTAPTSGTWVSINRRQWIGVSGGVTWEYRWLRGATLISGATSQVYQLQAGDVGESITAEVRGINSFGTGDWFVSDAVVPA